MANINPYLEAIMNAVYGEEVRGSIYNALSAMNEESTDAKSAATSAQDSAKNAATTATNASNTASTASASAQSAKTAAETARTAAETAQKNAAASAASAATSESNAAASETNAKLAEQSIDSKVEDVMGIKYNLITYHAIYSDLEDSDATVLNDSTGNNISSQIVYPDMDDVIGLQNKIASLDLLLADINNALTASRLTELENSTVNKFNEIMARVNNMDSTIQTIQNNIDNLINYALLDNNYNNQMEEINDGEIN